MLMRPARVTAMLAISLIGMASTIAACASNTPPPTPPRAVATPTTSSASTTPSTGTSAATPSAGVAAPLPAAPAARKPSGTLIVQQPSLRNVPMVPQLAGAGLTVYHTLIYDYLTTLQYDEATGQYSSGPGLATRWEHTADLKNWTFYLRQGIQWQDGNGEFTAEDVKYSVDNVLKNPAVIAPSASTQALKRIIDSVEILDPYKVTFHLNSPYGTLDSLLSNLWTAPPLSKKYLDKVGLDQANKKPVGTGSYKFGELKVGESLRLDAVDEHWRQVPYYKTILFKEVQEASTAVAMLKTGDADIIVAPITMKDEIVAGGFEARINPQTEYTYALFGGQWDQEAFPKEVDPKTPWRDIRVRQAMNIALDRDQIVKSLYKNQARPAPVVLFMPGTIGYNPDLKPYPYDPARAKQLLADAGYPKGFDFNMNIYPWTHAPEIPDLGQVLAQYWSKIGINAKISWSDFTTVQNLSAAKKDSNVTNPYGFTRMATPEAHLELFFDPKGRYAVGAPEIWKLTQQFEGEGEPAKKDLIGRQIAQKIYDSYLFVPVAWSSMPYYVNPKKVGDWPFLKGQPYMMRLEYLKHPGDK